MTLCTQKSGGTLPTCPWLLSNHRTKQQGQLGGLKRAKEAFPSSTCVSLKNSLGSALGGRENERNLASPLLSEKHGCVRKSQNRSGGGIGWVLRAGARQGGLAVPAGTLSSSLGKRTVLASALAKSLLKIPGCPGDRVETGTVCLLLFCWQQRQVPPASTVTGYLLLPGHWGHHKARVSTPA